MRVSGGGGGRGGHVHTPQKIHIGTISPKYRKLSVTNCTKYVLWTSEILKSRENFKSERSLWDYKRSPCFSAKCEKRYEDTEKSKYAPYKPRFHTLGSGFGINDYKKYRLRKDYKKKPLLRREFAGQTIVYF